MRMEREWENLEKLPAWQLTKVKNKKEVILEAQKGKTKVHFATVMDICHLKNLEFKKRSVKSTKGWVVLRGDTVKDDSSSYAVFTEQGSSLANQMTAAKSMDVIARLPNCAGQAADAVSAYTSKSGGRSKVLKIPKSEFPDTLNDQGAPTRNFGGPWPRPVAAIPREGPRESKKEREGAKSATCSGFGTPPVGPQPLRPCPSASHPSGLHPFVLK